MAKSSGAKRSRLVVCAVAALAATACAGLERFAPPGIVKYEDLAGDKPQNPEIVTRVAEAKKSRAGDFPVLSKAPQVSPEAMPLVEQAALKTGIADARDALALALAADLASARAEREAPILLRGVAAEALLLEDLRDALAQAVEADDTAARTERGLPQRAPDADGR